MVLYNCECCDFSSKIKTHYNRHLKTKKHLSNYNNNVISMVESQKEPEKSQKEPQKSQKEPQKSQTDSDDQYFCEFCLELFTTFANKRRHELHRCKENNNFKNKLLNEQHKQIKKLEKTVDKLIDKAGNTTINNIKSSQTNQMNQQNIKLNNYGSEDLSHITDFFKTNLLGLPHGMIPKMIEAIHFNSDKPENKNILLPNKNDNKMKVFSGDKWVYKDKNEIINDLMDGKYFIMDTHYETICETTDNKFTLFKRFQALFDKRNKIIVETQKKECELLLLNNR
jgi:hypothetical protein